MKYPSISIVIPTLNASNSLVDCLASIKRQKYKGKIEVIVVDNYSLDNTQEIAKEYKARLLLNKIRDTQVSKRIGLNKSKGELFMWFDADMRMITSSWLIKMINPLIKDTTIVASITGYRLKGNESPLTKFLTMDIFQRDPVYQFFSPSIESMIVEKKRGYDLCVYKPNKIPAQGMGVFRKEALIKTVVYQGNKFMDLDNLTHLVNLGYERFAYVDVGVYHNFVKDMKTLLKKRLRNIKRNYLGQDFKRAYTWFDLKKPSDVLKIITWIIYVHLIIPETLRGIYKSIKLRTWVGLYQPIVSLLETDVIIFGLVYYLLNPSERYKQDGLIS